MPFWTTVYVLFFPHSLLKILVKGKTAAVVMSQVQKIPARSIPEKKCPEVRGYFCGYLIMKGHVLN